jgi:hypothetical protein
MPHGAKASWQRFPKFWYRKVLKHSSCTWPIGKMNRAINTLSQLPGKAGQNHKYAFLNL